MNEVVNGYSGALIAAIGGLAAFAATHLILRVVASMDFLLDRPNERSSHVVVTPRSGGIAILGGWLVGMTLTAGFVGWPGFAAECAKFAPLVIAASLFGLADDRFGLRPAPKFGAQILLAVAFVAAFGPLSAAPMPFVGIIELGVLGAPISIIWIVAFMNAFNFMDGVNGIAAACGALALAAGAAAAAFGGAPFWAVVCGLAAVSLIAFLPMNFPRARIFMGDNGSQAIGFLIAVGAIGIANATSARVSSLFLPCLMLPFIYDVGFTLIDRLRRRQNLLAPHREHLYQLLLRQGFSHAGVTAAYLSVTALCAAVSLLMLRAPADGQWLAPALAAAVLTGPALTIRQRAMRLGLLTDGRTKAVPVPHGDDIDGLHQSPARAAE
jgi:UDP-GlcNAc:undecaprenyl-phosphate GlcNAc-1-phosphate transferase